MAKLTARKLLEESIADAEVRARHITDQRVDAIVKALCEQFGYGAVMDSSMRQWLQKDPHGAFIIGPCMGVAKGALSTREEPK